jgi:hypothetical protein
MLNSSIQKGPCENYLFEGYYFEILYKKVNFRNDDWQEERVFGRRVGRSSINHERGKKAAGELTRIYRMVESIRIG